MRSMLDASIFIISKIQIFIKYLTRAYQKHGSGYLQGAEQVVQETGRGKEGHALFMICSLQPLEIYTMCICCRILKTVNKNYF